MKDVVMVFTSKSLETMRQEGGSGNWKSNADRLQRAKWIVATRNQKSNWAQGDEGHGTAFLIGRGIGVKPSPPSRTKRFVVMFDEYAELSITKAWTNNRNPVAYTDLASLGIKPEELEWKPFSAQTNDRATPAEHKPSTSQTGTIVDEARAMVARALDIAPDAVKITIAL